MIKKIVLGLAVALILTGTGCAGAGNPFHDPVNGPTIVAAAKISLQYGVIKFIDEDPARAEAVLKFTDAALAVAEEDMATPDNLGLKLNALIPFDKLEPAERALVSSLLELAIVELKRRVELPGSVPLADVREVLSWVKQAAELSLPR